VDGEQAADPGGLERGAGRPEQPRQLPAQRVAPRGVPLRGLGRVDLGEAGVARARASPTASVTASVPARVTGPDIGGLLDSSLAQETPE
jgi:hypothetical protein